LAAASHPRHRAKNDATSLGTFEQVLLTAIVSLEGSAYGVTIHARAQELSGPRKVVLGAVYATLDRLEDKGLIHSRMSEPRPERGGRSRRYYGLTAAGEAALKEAAATARRLCDVVERQWGKQTWSQA
jgi:PadR family transcriptional regulator, regulatory protein PadR